MEAEKPLTVQSDGMLEVEWLRGWLMERTPFRDRDKNRCWDEKEDEKGLARGGLLPIM